MNLPEELPSDCASTRLESAMKSRTIRRDDEAQSPFGLIIVLLGIVLVLVGLFLISTGSWSFGLATIGVGCILGGFGGIGSIETPVGTIVGGAGIILLVAAFAINQIFNR